METAKKIWNIVTWTIVVLAIVMAVLLAGVRLVGIDPYTVLSGSMEPTYHVGSIIYVVDVDPHELKAGDPVTYMLSETTVVTHRIVEVVPAVDEEGNPVINEKTGKQVVRFVTKGDANNAVDGSLLHENNVIGKPIFSVPLLGYVANYVQNPPGTYFAIILACLLLLATFLPDLLFPDKPEKKKDEQPVAASDDGAASDDNMTSDDNISPEADAVSESSEDTADGDNSAE